jgi:hypothetical protein
MKVGTILIATSICKMNDGDQKALIIGKEYKIKKLYEDEFIITSELGQHWFDIDDLYKFFKIK